MTGEGKEVGYSYNGDGLLYERTEGGKTTRYYYDEEAKLIAEAEVKVEQPRSLTLTCMTCPVNCGPDKTR